MQYTCEFYRALEDDARAAAIEIVPWVLQLVAPRSVVDVGCASGIWLAEFESRGVRDIVGLDLGTAASDLRIPPAAFQAVDLSRSFGLERNFDLALCLEVAEHLPGAAAASLVGSIVTLAPVVLFSAAIPFQGGTHHVNEQWPDYWAELFARHDFLAFDCLRPRFWDNDRIAWWYRQNAIFYVHRAHLASCPGFARLEPSTPPRLVHPLNYLEHANPERHGVRWLVGELPAAIARFARRWAARAFRGDGRKA